MLHLRNLDNLKLQILSKNAQEKKKLVKIIINDNASFNATLWCLNELYTKCF